MPNHLHILIRIDYQHTLVKKSCIPIRMRTTQGLSLAMHSRRYNLLSKVIGALKMTSSKLIHLDGFLDFGWQRSFHDHVIKNKEN